jgi:rhodanese-related sulfurtransferase
MGPIYPEPNFNLMLAMVIGFFFGYLLENAGFSSSKKLVGVFYGYDFTVWRVFFTAAITGMVGILALGHFGLLNLDAIYINPLYLWSVIVGGIVMGFGFIIGGYCPGTSIASTMIGKMDALFVVLGVGFGIFLFIVGYPWFEGLHKGSYLGTPQLFDTLNISMGLFTFIIIIFAFFTYWGVAKIEEKVNKGANADPTPKGTFIKMTTFAFVVAILALFMPPKKTSTLEEFAKPDFGKDMHLNYITPDEVAVRLIKGDKTMQFVDLRTPGEFKKLALPYAVNAKPSDFCRMKMKNVFNAYNKITIIYSNDDNLDRRAAALAVKVGYEPQNIFVLKGGFPAFKKDILDFKMPAVMPTDSIVKDTYLFRHEFGPEVYKILKNSKPRKVVIPKVKRALGGCG